MEHFIVDFPHLLSIDCDAQHSYQTMLILEMGNLPDQTRSRIIDTKHQCNNRWSCTLVTTITSWHSYNSADAAGIRLWTVATITQQLMLTFIFKIYQILECSPFHFQSVFKKLLIITFQLNMQLSPALTDILHILKQPNLLKFKRAD